MTTPHTAAPLYCRDCGAVDSSGRAGWMCRTCGTILPSDCPDAKATAIAAKVARDLGCADLDDVPDALKRVLADNADAEIHRRVLTEQSDAQRTRADAAEEALTRLRSKHAAVYRQATHDRVLRVAAEEALTTAREERDAARAEAAGLRGDVADVVRSRDALRARVEGRASAPTEAEVRAHAAARGRWLISHEVEAGRRLVYTLDAGWEDALGEVRRPSPGLRWWALDASGRPCDWPRSTPRLRRVRRSRGRGGERHDGHAECRCGHPVEMHRGADRCGAYGCGCDLSAEEAGWS